MLTSPFTLKVFIISPSVECSGHLGGITICSCLLPACSRISDGMQICPNVLKYPKIRNKENADSSESGKCELYNRGRELPEVAGG